MIRVNPNDSQAALAVEENPQQAVARLDRAGGDREALSNAFASLSSDRLREIGRSLKSAEKQARRREKRSGGNGQARARTGPRRSQRSIPTTD